MDTAIRLEALDQTTRVVVAMIERNLINAQQVAETITEIHTATVAALMGSVTVEETAPAALPAVNPKKSVTDDFIICLEDGKKFKSLKRHLTHFGLTPDQYRAKWGLAADYPMVAPNYAAARSQLAKDMGLGKKRAGAVK